MRKNQILRNCYGGSKEQELSFFDQHPSNRAIDDAIDFFIKVAQPLGTLYRGLKLVMPLFMLENNCLYLVKDWLSGDRECQDEALKAVGKD